MSAYLKKARNNIATAEMLLDNGLALPSAHPAYYSSFLLIKYTLAHFFSLSYTQQDEVTRFQNSHKILSDQALCHMADQDFETGTDYMVWYNKLQMMRRKADYKPDFIDESHLRDNLLYAKAFMESVANHFINVNK